MGSRGALATHTRNTTPHRFRLGIPRNEAGHFELADFQILFHFLCLRYFYWTGKATEKRCVAVSNNVKPVGAKDLKIL